MRRMTWYETTGAHAAVESADRRPRAHWVEMARALSAIASSGSTLVIR